MGSRLTLSWESCSLCGRKSPTLYCKRLGIWVCAWCASIVDCEGYRARAIRRPERTLAPDESLIESLAARRRVGR